MADRPSLLVGRFAPIRARACDTYYRLRPAQAGKNRGIAYRLLKKARS